MDKLEASIYLEQAGIGNDNKVITLEGIDLNMQFASTIHNFKCFFNVPALGGWTVVYLWQLAHLLILVI
jgi:hypothetical protein